MARVLAVPRAFRLFALADRREHFTGAWAGSAVKCVMLKRVLPAVIVLLGLSLPLVARPAADEAELITSEDLRISGETEVAPALSLSRPDLFKTVDSAVLLHGLPALTLLDGRRFPISSALGRMGHAPVVNFPVAFVQAVEVKKGGPSLRHGSDSAVGTVDLRLKRLDYGGEVGFFYGKSTGDYGREDYSAYIVSGIGNEKFNITVGASYQETTFNGPRRTR